MPARKRRNAIVPTSYITLGNQLEEPHQTTAPQTFHSQFGHQGNEFNESSNPLSDSSYHSSRSHDPYVHPYSGYPVPSVYAGPNGMIQYSARNSVSPGYSPQGGYSQLSPVMAPTPTPQYDPNTITGAGLNHLSNTHMPTVQSSPSTQYDSNTITSTGLNHISNTHMPTVQSSPSMQTLSGSGHYGLSGRVVAIASHSKIKMPSPQYVSLTYSLCSLSPRLRFVPRPDVFSWYHIDEPNSKFNASTLIASRSISVQFLTLLLDFNS
jgi:hypothetical protein